MPVNGQLLVPSKVDIPQILNSIGYSDRYINDHQDKYNYVLHKILINRVLNKFIDEKNHGYTPINRDQIRSILGQPYADNVIKELLTWNIIECDNKKQTGVKSYGYRITEAYQSKAILRFVFKESFDAKLKKMSQMYKASKCREHRLVWKNLNQIGIHSKAALEFISAKYDVNDPEQVDKYNTDLAAIYKIYNEQYFIEQPDAASRIYTNITNLSRELRPFLFNKKLKTRLVNIDIRNSQPFLFSLLLKEAYGDNLPDDVQWYIELTSQGMFYEFMMKLLGVPDDKRTEFKEDFFGKIFYCKSTYSRRTAEGKMFELHFPNVYTVVNAHKEEAYQNLAIRMQRNEASIILNSVGRCLQDQGIFYATIHDSVVTLEKHVEEVKEIILNTFLTKLGITPSVNRENLYV